MVYMSADSHPSKY